MKFDFDRWFGVIDEDNRADDYYSDDCDNLMVPTGNGEYKCPVCGCTEGSTL